MAYTLSRLEKHLHSYYNHCMVLYIDETEHEEYFIVAGLLAKSEQDVDLAYKKFKKSIKGYPMSGKAKERVFLEFKSTLIDVRFQKIKMKLLQQVNEIDGAVLYSCYAKKQKNMKEVLKESVYITLLANIVNNIEAPVDIVFDAFNNKRFEESIVNTFIDFDNVTSIVPFDSQKVPGLQFADNVCSVIRLHLTEHDKENYYALIEDMIKQV